ncbi:MAG: pentapeptide repeat-containing protein [Bacilli bacterium]
MSRCNLQGADLRGADLTRASLREGVDAFASGKAAQTSCNGISLCLP